MASIFDYLKELTKIDLECEDEQGNIKILKSYIKSFDEGKILIEPPIYNSQIYSPPVGEKIRIIVSTKEGIYMGDSEVIGKELSTISGVWISYPYNSQRIQRREFVRIPKNVEVDLKIIEDQAGTQIRNEKIFTRDISGTGISFVSDTPLLTKYFDIEAQIHLKDDNDEPIITKCEHIYTKNKIINGNRKVITALAYVDINSYDTDRIVRECFKYQLEMRKRSI